MFSLFFGYYLKKFRRYFAANRAARFITVFLFFAVFTLLLIGVFLFFRQSFRFLALDPFFNQALLLYAYELFLLVSFLLIFASALISGIFMLFRGEEDLWFMASPRFSAVPLWKTVRIALASVWPIFVIILPALAAVRAVSGMGFAGFLSAFLSVLALAVFAVISAEILLLCIALILSWTGRPALNIRNLSIVAVLVFAVKLVVIWRRLQFINFYEFFTARILEIPTAPLDPILAQFRIFPSHPGAVAISAFGRSDMSAGLGAVLAGLIWFAAAILIFYFLQKKFLRLWQTLQDGQFEAGGSAMPSGARKPSAICRAPGQMSAIFRKEAYVFLRNTKGILWLGFLMLIWAIQAASVFLLSRRFGGERVSAEVVPGLVAVLQFAVAVYFVSMFVLRFAFPAFSLEKKTAWLIGSAPLEWGKIFMGKLLFYGLFFTGLGVFFAVFNRGLVLLSGWENILFIAVVAISSFVLTAFGLGLGAIFPNFETDDPEILSTTLPGLGFMSGAIVYGAFSALALRWYFLNLGFLPLAAWMALSIVAVWFFITIPRKFLARLEF